MAVWPLDPKIMLVIYPIDTRLSRCAGVFQRHLKAGCAISIGDTPVISNEIAGYFWVLLRESANFGVPQELRYENV